MDSHKNARLTYVRRIEMVQDITQRCRAIVDCKHRQINTRVCGGSVAVTHGVGEAGCAVVVGVGDEADVTAGEHAHRAVGRARHGGDG